MDFGGGGGGMDFGGGGGGMDFGGGGGYGGGSSYDDHHDDDDYRRSSGGGGGFGAGLGLALGALQSTMYPPTATPPPRRHRSRTTQPAPSAPPPGYSRIAAPMPPPVPVPGPAPALPPGMPYLMVSVDGKWSPMYSRQAKAFMEAKAKLQGRSGLATESRETGTGDGVPYEVMVRGGNYYIKLRDGKFHGVTEAPMPPPDVVA